MWLVGGWADRLRLSLERERGTFWERMRSSLEKIDPVSWHKNGIGQVGDIALIGNLLFSA